jgi:hypothetical protein
MSQIKWKHIFRQLKADLIGKDSYRGITLTYAWLANQFGHFALGFIPVLVLYTILRSIYEPDPHPYWSALIIAGFWLLFEIYNFLGPLLKKKTDYRFTPAWWNVAFDTATDLVFFWIGTVSAAILLDFSWPAFSLLIALILIVLYPSYYWFTTKMFQQYASYPFQFRLSQWTHHISKEDKDTVTGFLRNPARKHLLIFGATGAGKTTLSVGIANELSIRRRASYYTPAIKLYCMFHESEVKTDALWFWRNTEILVIDDINPGGPIKEDLVGPEKFLQYLDAVNVNREVIRSRSVIWVLGNHDSSETLRNKWSALLETIGVRGEDVLSINLARREGTG